MFVPRVILKIKALFFKTLPANIANVAFVLFIIV